eukprot:2037488-Pleurochrysis_carterae.AAC.1
MSDAKGRAAAAAKLQQRLPRASRSLRVGACKSAEAKIAEQREAAEEHKAKAEERMEKLDEQLVESVAIAQRV